ncbi:type I DNA topoisomerase [Croceimicrobium hydrocarbonivorans]|uniref:DNA topoisomerase 1 n=1 Tax=Croceimicrobium hydrocarbonivorans TaxID=2761580 RepID=A0A7H0VI44_9FLAO|nr:type I DNA topoisomerase [Croceimicrobium hydrocarbonivorans]QNR25392.1 type I DNA topoisomerase [Croceimicrobium hydrocarbonivorans]
MAKNLVIVESPAKAKTIEKFLGKEYQVESSYGHIRDLVQKDMGVDVENNFEPKYAISSDKKEVVKKLKKLSKDAEMVWLASDEDREGEAIAWHLYEALGLTPTHTNRITFSEITKKAIDKAIQNPRRINTDLVNAQQARRVLDRLVGFELSPVLWKKVKAGLSAGRVQSVAVRLIVEREMEIRNFEAKSYFRVVAEFQNASGKTFKAELNKRFDTENEAREFLDNCAKHSFKIDSVETKPAKKSPAPPFTTSTLQQEAARKLYFSVSQTMSVAQKLYEAGLITYMRTDSTNLSDDALGAAQLEIEDQYGKDYSNTRRFATKSKGAQEAHEAIRPTYFNKHSAGTGDQQKRLYDLIWKRAIASQMSDAQLERTVFHIDAPGEKLEFVARGEVITFEGFLKVYLEGTDDEDSEEQSGMLPATKQGENLSYEDIVATQRFTKHPPRYTEASLVKKLEELGIGRPSTYAPTISTIIKRQYVEKSELSGTQRDYLQMTLADGTLKDQKLSETTGADKNKLIPTDIGTVVNGFLTEHFDQILDYNFTASVEAKFDQIAHGQEEWTAMLDEFYQDFHPHLKEVEENSDRATGERVLGEDPKSGKPIIARIGRYGPMIQIGEAEDEEKPRFASLQKGQSIDTISLEEALDLFKLPRELGEYQGEKVSANIGRFGPYVKYKSLFASIKAAEGDDPMTIELDRAIELIEAKIEADKNKYIKVFDEAKPVIEVLNGRYGPYLKSGRKNFKLPKDIEDPAKLTREEAEAIIADSAKKPAKGRAKKSTKK